MASLPPPSPFPPPPPPPVPPTPAKKSRAGLIGAGVAVAVAVLGGGVFVALRGGDDAASTTSTTTASTDAVTTTAAAPTTVADTLVITTPENPTTTVAQSVPGADEVVVTDDTGLFQVAAPADFEIDTAPLDIDGLQVASVTAAVNLANYDAGYDETGYTVMGLPADLAADAELAMTIFSDQLASDCVPPVEQPDLDTAIGAARYLVAEGCIENGSTAVVLVIDETNTGLVFAVLAQGLADPSTVTDLAKAVLESIYIN